jgi:hypothetical protein
MTPEDILLSMTVTNGINGETITMPATMHQKYETVIAPTKDNHGHETIENPTADGHVNGSSTPGNSHELKRNSTSFLVLNEAIKSTQVSVQNEGEPLALPVRPMERKGDLTSSLAPSNSHVDEDLLPPCTRLQRFLKETDDILVCPGVYDGFSARIALSVGFKAMYMVCGLRLMSCIPRSIY